MGKKLKTNDNWKDTRIQRVLKKWTSLSASPPVKNQGRVLLSTCTKKILLDAGVKDVTALLALTEDDIQKRLNCNERSAAEIAELQNKYLRKQQATSIHIPKSQEKLPSKKPALPAAEGTVPVSLDTVPAESVRHIPFDQMLSPLSVRARNVLFHAGIRDVPTLLSFTYDSILKCPNCGRKTADEITDFQLSMLEDTQMETAAPVPTPLPMGGSPLDLKNAGVRLSKNWALSTLIRSDEPRNSPVIRRPAPQRKILYPPPPAKNEHLSFNLDELKI